MLLVFSIIVVIIIFACLAWYRVFQDFTHNIGSLRSDSFRKPSEVSSGYNPVKGLSQNVKTKNTDT